MNGALMPLFVVQRQIVEPGWWEGEIFVGASLPDTYEKSALGFILL
jgi:hypothetical protein